MDGERRFVRRSGAVMDARPAVAALAVTLASAGGCARVKTQCRAQAARAVGLGVAHVAVAERRRAVPNCVAVGVTADGVSLRACSK